MNERKANDRWENPRDADPEENEAVITLQDTWGSQLYSFEKYKKARTTAGRRHEDLQTAAAGVGAFVVTGALFVVMTAAGLDEWWWLVLGPDLMLWTLSMFIVFAGVTGWHDGIKAKRTIPRLHDEWEAKMVAQMSAELDCTDEQLQTAWRCGPLNPKLYYFPYF